jgi:Fe2+ or Zn2+ uptake regulation protein
VVEIEECFPADVEAKIGRRHGFTQISHRLEFFGLCARCTGTPAP